MRGARSADQAALMPYWTCQPASACCNLLHLQARWQRVPFTGRSILLGGGRGRVNRFSRVKRAPPLPLFPLAGSSLPGTAAHWGASGRRRRRATARAAQRQRRPERALMSGMASMPPAAPEAAAPPGQALAVQSWHWTGCLGAASKTTCTWSGRTRSSTSWPGTGGR